MAKPGDWLKKETTTRASTEIKGPDIGVEEAQVAQVEAWLQRFGVRYSHLMDVALASIDVKGSRANQARSEALVEDSVARFVGALKAGHSLPPLVGYPVGGKVRLIDGNNREEALRKFGAERAKVFVLHPETPSETILLMTVDANAHHGVTPDETWRLRQAHHLTSLGFTLERAASAGAVTVAKLRDYQRRLKAVQRAQALKIPGFDALPHGQQSVLGALTMDPVFREAVRTVVDTGMSRPETMTLCRDLKALGSESEQVAHAVKVREERLLERAAREVRDRRVKVKSPKQGLVTGIGKILAADPQAVAAAFVTDIERKEMIRRLEEVGNALIELQIALEGGGEGSVRRAG